MKYEVTAGSQVFQVEVEDDGQVRLDGEAVSYDFQEARDPNLYSLILDKESHEMRISVEDEAYQVLLMGDNIAVTVLDERSRRLAGVRKRLGADSGDVLVKAPMPGLIIDVLVKVGDEVALGQTLVILESMKMHNEFKAPRNAKVKEIRVEVGDKVLPKQTMVILG